jgi:hypothetical protein
MGFDFYRDPLDVKRPTQTFAETLKANMEEKAKVMETQRKLLGSNGCVIMFALHRIVSFDKRLSGASGAWLSAIGAVAKPNSLGVHPGFRRFMCLSLHRAELFGS